MSMKFKVFIISRPYFLSDYSVQESYGFLYVFFRLLYKQTQEIFDEYQANFNRDNGDVDLFLWRNGE